MAMKSQMTVRILIWLLATGLLATAPSAAAQQQKKVPQIGYLAATKAAAVAARVAAFRQGLRELGYVEGKNIVVEYRYADGKADRERELATELAHLKVAVIVATGPSVTRAAKEATSTIPIIMSQDPDPVASGFVASLARPGGNITGLSNLSAELSGKRLELLKEIVPNLSRVAVLGDSNEPGNAQILKEMELAAGALKVKLEYLDVLTFKDIETAFRTATKAHADGVVLLGSAVFNAHRIQIVELAAKSRLPATYTRPEYVDAGGLMTYGPSINDLFRRSATYVDKILKGAKPADLPVEQPAKFELIINLKTASQIGLTIPPNVLARADKVIK
jgi:putative tryptophan/tyrosine transport system substrate-binding protein